MNRRGIHLKIGIAGAGAVGGYFGAYLKQAGHDVVFLTRGKHLEAMKQSGLTIIENHDERMTIHGVFTEDLSSFLDASLILFCVKSPDTRATAEQIKSLGNDDSIILTLQNGVDNEEILIDIFGEERVLSAATYISSHVEKPGVIKQEGVVKLIIGSLHEAGVPTCQQIADVLNEANIDTAMSDSIMESKWKKVLWNATFNPLAALSKATVGEILDDEELRMTAEQVCREVLAVANKNGIPLGEKMLDVTFKKAEFARGHKPSMLQDRLHGKQMEIESLSGYFVKKGRELCVETPATQALYSNLLFIENGQHVVKR